MVTRAMLQERIKQINGLEFKLRVREMENAQLTSIVHADVRTRVLDISSPKQFQKNLGRLKIWLDTYRHKSVELEDIFRKVGEIEIEEWHANYKVRQSKGFKKLRKEYLDIIGRRLRDG